jgi:hypothetical protein
MLSDDLPSPQFIAPVRTRAEANKYQRVKVSVLGRYMLADRREFPCQILEMSPGDALVIAPVAGVSGEKVIAYVDLVGRIEGTILNQMEGGFLMDIAASPRKRDKMAAQLTWLANKDILNLPEDRRHERVVPDIRHSTVVLDDGRRYNCKSMRARVVRHFQNGVAVEFASAQEMLTVIQQNLRMN